MNRSLAELRAAQAAELAASGMTYEAIARKLGFRDRSGAWRAARRCLRGRQDLAASLMVERSLVDLHFLDRRYWNRAMSGDVKAARLVLRGIEAQALLRRDLSTQRSQQAGGKGPEEVPSPVTRRRPKGSKPPELGPFVDFAVY